MISKILDRLYIGDSSITEEELKSNEIKYLINVGGVDMGRMGVVSIHHHLTDDECNPPWKIFTVLDFLKDYVHSGRTIVICRAGQSRSVYIVVQWLIRAGMSPTEALQFVKERHPIAQVNPGLWRTI